MARYTKEQLEVLKRKGIVALCKEHDIKCIGKNSELIEQLLELPEEAEKPLETQATIKEASTIGEEAEDEDSIDVAINLEDSINGIASVEEAAALETDVKPDVSGEPTDGYKEAIIDETPEAEDEITKDKPLEPSTEQGAFSPQTRRLSVRLSGVHLGRHLDTPKPKPSSLNQSSVPNPVAGLKPKQADRQKENARPALFNKNISHIPTLKERVSKLSSLPSTMKRPSHSAAIAKRPKYDPKASLRKPLSYKPYTGPIKKPFS